MGYFKSIEQFLFSYISLHTIEKDSVNRKIFAGAKPLDTLSDKLLNDSSKVKNINGKLQVQVSHPDKPVSACCN